MDLIRILLGRANFKRAVCWAIAARDGNYAPTHFGPGWADPYQNGAASDLTCPV